MDRLSFFKIKTFVMRWAGHYTWAFVAVIAVTLVSFVFSAHYLLSLETDLKDLYENDVRGGDAVQSASSALLAVENGLKDQILFSDRKSAAQARIVVQERLSQLKAAMATAGPRFYTPKAKQALAESREDLKTFVAALQATQTVIDQGRRPEARMWNELQHAGAALQSDLDLLVANRIANSSIGMGELVAQLRWSLFFTAALVIITLAIRIVLYRAGHPNRRGPRQDG